MEYEDPSKEHQPDMEKVLDFSKKLSKTVGLPPIASSPTSDLDLFVINHRPNTPHREDQQPQIARMKELPETPSVPFSLDVLNFDPLVGRGMFSFLNAKTVDEMADAMIRSAGLETDEALERFVEALAFERRTARSIMRSLGTPQLSNERGDRIKSHLTVLEYKDRIRWALLVHLDKWGVRISNTVLEYLTEDILGPLPTDEDLLIRYPVKLQRMLKNHIQRDRAGITHCAENNRKRNDHD